MTDPPRTFCVRITEPDGLCVTVIVTVPAAADWPESAETSELAQMGAASTMRRVLDTRRQSLERVPF